MLSALMCLKACFSRDKITNFFFILNYIALTFIIKKVIMPNLE